jgi:hypothetical protein
MEEMRPCRTNLGHPTANGYRSNMENFLVDIHSIIFVPVLERERERGGIR